MVISTMKGVAESDLMRSGSAWVEVVNGEMVEIDMGAAGFLHAIVIDNLREALKRNAVSNKLGYVLGDGLTYNLASGSEGIYTARIPDVSFLSKGRIPKDFDLKRPIPGAPDLAVEVMSPDDRAVDMQLKIEEYLNAGAQQVWVLYPEQATLHQYFRDDRSKVRVYRGTDTIDAEALFPGLKLTASELFIVPDLS
jgi:Uma2 family endonuclease